MSAPSDEYLGLAVTLLDSLGDSQSSTETVLLQLQALFGPMLTSALQLVDKREVVRVSLPSARYVYQVSSSTGQPYTLYLDLPESVAAPRPDSPKKAFTSEAGPIAHEQVVSAQEIRNTDQEDATGDQADPTAKANIIKRHQLRRDAQTLKKLYCPCPGYAYNALAGDKNVLCKHLLAALIAWKTERAVKTEVSLLGVIDLLALHSSASSNDPYPPTTLSGDQSRDRT